LRGKVSRVRIIQVDDSLKDAPVDDPVGGALLLNRCGCGFYRHNNRGRSEEFDKTGGRERVEDEEEEEPGVVDDYIQVDEYVWPPLHFSAE